MDRNEILEKMRRENKDADERELRIRAEAGSRACAVGGFVCAAITLFCAIVDRFDHPVALGAWAILEAMLAAKSLYLFAKLRIKRELVRGCAFLLLAVWFLAMLVWRMIG